LISPLFCSYMWDLISRAHIWCAFGFVLETGCYTNTSLHSHSLHITNAPDAAGPRSRHGSHWRALTIVVAREASELLHRLPCHVILALGDANDAHGLIFHASVWFSLHQLVAATWREKVRNLNQSKKSRKQVCIEMQVHDSRNYSSWTYKYASLVDGRQNKKKSFIHILNSKKGTVDGHIKK